MSSKQIKHCVSDVAGNGHKDLIAPPFPKRGHKSIASSNGGVTDTTAHTIDDSFTEVTHRKGRRENKQMAKEQMLEEKVSKQLAHDCSSSFQRDNLNSQSEGDQSVSFEGSSSLPLTKKKQQYLEQAIIDRSGQYDYAEDPGTYKKARKRLQNRESAVRSRMKKRQEMEVLEEQVRKLAEQKAAVESANDELKRQNKYWEDLFAKQQLQSVVPVTVAPTLSNAPTLTPSSSHDGRIITQSTFSDLTRSADGSELAESSYDPDYTALKMASDRGNKRQKRSADGSMKIGGLFEFDRSQDLDDHLNDEEGTYERAVKADIASLQRTVSIDNFEQRTHNRDLDDCFLERQPNERGSSLFFGLAIVFGAVGAVTSMGATNVDTSIGDRIEFSSSSSMAGAKVLRTAESNPIKDGEEVEHLTSFVEVDPSSPSSNINTAFFLLLQAVRTLPVFTYVSFFLSLIFLVLYLKTWSFLTASASSSRISSQEKKAVRQQRSSQSQSGRTKSAKQQTGSASGKQSSKTSQRRQK